MFYHEKTASFGSVLTSLAFSALSIVSAAAAGATPISDGCPTGLDLSPDGSYEGSLAAGEQLSLRIELPASGVLSLALEPTNASGVELRVSLDPCSGISAETDVFTIERSAHHQRLALTEPGAVMVRLAVHGDGSPTDFRLDTRFEAAEVRDEWVAVEVAGEWFEGPRTSLHHSVIEKIDTEPIDPDPDSPKGRAFDGAARLEIASSTALRSSDQTDSTTLPRRFEVVTSRTLTGSTEARISWRAAAVTGLDQRIDTEPIDPDPDTGGGSGSGGSGGGGTTADPGDDTQTVATRIDTEPIDPDPDTGGSSLVGPNVQARSIVFTSVSRADDDTAEGELAWLLALVGAELDSEGQALTLGASYRLRSYVPLSSHGHFQGSEAARR